VDNLILVRGLPGAGKTTVSKLLTPESLYYDKTFSADHYFYDDKGNYNFNSNKLTSAHYFCQDKLIKSIEEHLDFIKAFGNLFNDVSFIVDNTFTTEKEIKIYEKIAVKYNLRFISLIVENRHGNKSVHNVPEKTVEKMRNRFSIKL